MRHTVNVVAIALGLLAASCGGLSSEENQQLSSGYLGCRPSEITVDEEQGHSIETWTASCRGRTFHCMRGGSAIFYCSEDHQPTSGGEQPAVPPAQPPAEP